MAGTGTGSPAYFQCPKWRRQFHETRGRPHVVELTGREGKPRKYSTPRHGKIPREFRCLTCGHVGWSYHNDLEHMKANT